jgi:hypothetical protein
MIMSYNPQPLWYVCLLIIAGLGFYWIRCKSQWFYGICELISATIVFYLTVRPPVFSFSPVHGTGMDIPVISPWLSYFFGILAGVYLFVRGMDNIHQDASQRVRHIFDRLFGQRIKR